MSLRKQPLGPVPEDTAMVARAAFKRKGNVYVQLADALSDLIEFDDFSELFPSKGKLAEHPVRLALLTLVQFMEGLSDRQAGEAVVSRIDLRYLLRLSLTEPVFDFSLLSEFRSRLIAGQAEELLFNKILHLADQLNLLKTKKQRTDSTHVLAAVRRLSRLELLCETMLVTLEVLAEVVPEWTRTIAPQDWYYFYGEPGFNFKLPKKDKERIDLALKVGSDGFYLLGQIDGNTESPWLAQIPAVVTLRRVWEEQFDNDGNGPKWRQDEDLKPSGDRVSSPHDTDARLSSKRTTTWLGYKVHVTETCEDDAPRLITNVYTAPATDSEHGSLLPIHQSLSARGLKPEEHLIDGGYSRVEAMQEIIERYGVDLIGKISSDSRWQAREGKGFDLSCFSVDFEKKQAVCPNNITSSRWRQRRNGDAIEISFPTKQCIACPYKSDCTKSETHGRRLEIKAQPAFDFLREYRKRQETAEFKSKYATRAGVEGTHSQAVRRSGVRNGRYIGLVKTHLQTLLTATAINCIRIINWLQEKPLAQTRTTRFRKLAMVA